MISNDLSKVYILMRFEEQRSKLAQIGSTFQHINQNIKTIHNAFGSQGLSPPVLYSKPVFEEIAKIIYIVGKKLQNINAASDYEILAEKHLELSSFITKLMTSLTSLQQLQDQRISGMHDLKIVEYQPTLQSEYSVIGKVYNAVDALSYELMESCFGEKKVEEMQYVPASLFGCTYQMLPINLYRPGSFLIMVPYYDCFRSRFWPALAHETAHVMVETTIKSNLSIPLFDLMMNSESVLLESLMSNFGSDDNKSNHIKSNDKSIKNDENAVIIRAQEYLLPQIIEIVCDVVSAFICGPASFFTGSTFLSFTYRRVDLTLLESILFDRHPPIEIRLAAMRRVLESFHLSSIYPNLYELMNGTQSFFDGSLELDESDIYEQTYPIENKTYDYSILPEFLYDYNENTKLLTDSVVNILRDRGLKPFDKDKWKNVIDNIENESFSDLTPIQLMNIAWMTRLKRDIDDRNRGEKEIFEKRKSERKLFETIVHYMYGYYEDRVVDKIMRYP